MTSGDIDAPPEFINLNSEPKIFFLINLFIVFSNGFIFIVFKKLFDSILSYIEYKSLGTEHIIVGLDFFIFIDIFSFLIKKIIIVI